MAKILRPTNAQIHPRTEKINQIDKTNYWMIKMANGWTAERRLRQSMMIRKWKPWEQSTGAKTPEGKRRSSQNALANGGGVLMSTAELEQINDLLRRAKELLKSVRDD
jgi:hypothetical protein